MTRDSRLRVLHVTATLAPRMGGPSKVAVEMCEALAAKGVEVTLFSTNMDDYGRWIPFASPDVLDVPTNRAVFISQVERRYFPTRWPSRFAFSPDMWHALRERTDEFDIVHIHSLYLFPSLAASFLARRWQVPYIVRPHGTLDPYLRRRHSLRKALYDIAVQGQLLDRAAAIHYTSEEERRLVQPLGIKAPGLVIPLGVNLKEFERIPPIGSFRALHPNLENKRLIVFLGRLTPKKGLDLLVRAFAMVARTFSDAHLVIAGPDDEGLGDRIRLWVESVGMRDRVTLTGMVRGKEKLAVLADSAVWVLPSYTENFAVAAVEAMACGIPVVISDRVNIHPEVSRAGAGLVVPCDVKEISLAISRILADGQLRKRLRMSALQLVRDRFTWERAATRLIEVYEHISTEKNTATVVEEA